MISAEELKKLLDFSFDAYQNKNSSGQEYRQDGNVPYIMHPLWCASVLINDTRIPLEERELGFKALLLHDVLENTTLELPEWAGEDVKEMVEAMSFGGQHDIKEVIRELSKKPALFGLLMLIDALSSMYEEHVSEKKKKFWKLGVKTLTELVEKQYGDIRIIQISRAVTENTNW